MKHIVLILFVAMQYGLSAQCTIDADFDYAISGGNVSFSNTTNNEPANPGYFWEYGGQTSSTENPTFAYSAGIPFACLTVWDIMGTCSDTICISIVDSSGCNLNLDWTESTSGSNITFTNTSTGEPSSASYAWLYGSQSSSLENPTFTYDPAVTQVCFAINDLTGNGCDDSICGPVMDSTGCNLDVDFDYWVGTTTISFNDLSIGVPVGASYDWWYGSQNSSVQNPTFNIEPGDIYACLTVYDSTWTCYDSVCVFINADSTGGCNLIADFTMTIDSGYVYFTNTSTGEPFGANYDWWYNGQSSSTENPMFMLNDSGAWACLTVYDSLWNCYDSTCFFVDPASASNNEIEQMEVQLFPNPATSEVNLTFINTTAQEIVIYDASGRLVQQLYPNASANKLTIDVAEFEKGIYIINVIDSETSSYITKRFVKL